MTKMNLIAPALATALAKKGYESLTPVQEAVLDSALETQDLLVSAQTGSGKTVAFGIALAPTLLGDAERFPKSDTPLAVCIAPTRELALQVKRELEWLYKDAGALMASCVGGMDMRDERRALGRGAHIVVGTPGRLCDHIKRGSLDMTGLKAIVLDEADEMLNMGFREELELILGAAPEERRTLMFSATVPKSILGMTKKYQRNAVRVNTAAEAKQHLDIEYRVLTVSKNDKENAIINVLRYYDAKNAIVFGDTRAAVNRMASRFNNRGFKAVILSGELSQKDRSSAMQALRSGRAKVCIATDVAARGLDLPDLELVIHADIPKNKEALLHRSGRTGRAGRKGVSALIVPHNGRRKAERILNAAKVKAEWANPPSAEDVIDRDNERLLASDMLQQDVGDKEMEMVKQLLEQHSPEKIAAAFVRQYRTTYSAPEELTDAGGGYDPSDDRGGKNRGGNDRQRKTKPRNDFNQGVWFSLNLGRKQKAEPRWILPMLCKSGELKKGEIGSIKIAETTTYVEVAPSGVERFIEAIGPNGKIEGAITARKLDGAPDFSDPEQRPQYKPRDKSTYKKKRKSTPPAPKSKSSEKPVYKEPKPDPFDSATTRPPKGKKPHKKKMRAAAARAAKSSGKGGKPSGPKSGAKSGAKLSRKKRKS